MDTSSDLTGLKCQFKTYHHGKKKDGTVSIESIREPFGGLRLNEIEENLYAIIIKRFFGEKTQLEKTTVKINSPFLLKVFQSVIISYPTASSDFSSSLELESPFQMLFHYWDELDQRRASSQDADERMHLNLLLDFMAHEIGPARERVLEMTKQNHITYLNAWCIFRPGDLVYTSFMSRPWLLRCESTEYEANTTRGPYINVHCSYTDHDGTISGQTRHVVRMYQKELFGGDNPAVITALPAYPYKFYAEREEEGFKAMLEERGRKFLSLKDASVVAYSGMAEYLRGYDDTYFHYEMATWEGVWLQYTESGRIILDRKTFQEDESYAHPVSIRRGEADPLLCPPSTFAFSISRKEWCRVLVDLIRGVEWKGNAWKSLIIPNDEKLILQALITSHIYPESPRDQMQQKGKGLVVLLHGTPGSGKTLTAETAAEASCRALISTSSGELNKWNSPPSFEYHLKRILRYATTWKAIVLLDEADVFLEARDDNQSERNALVAVFLRELEYFSGTVFLTTNRIDSFDKAMRSRIHLSLGYSPPDLNSRHQLWLQLLRAIPSEEIEVDLDEDLEFLAAANLNGREIANAVNTSRTIARFESKPLQFRHIETVLKVGSAFDDRLKRAKASSGRDAKPLVRKDSMIAEA